MQVGMRSVGVFVRVIECIASDSVKRVWWEVVRCSGDQHERQREHARWVDEDEEAGSGSRQASIQASDGPTFSGTARRRRDMLALQ